MRRWRQWVFPSLAVTQQCAYERLNYLAQFRFSRQSCPARRVTADRCSTRTAMASSHHILVENSKHGRATYATARRIRSLEPAIGPEKAVDNYRNSTAPSPARHGGCKKNATAAPRG